MSSSSSSSSSAAAGGGDSGIQYSGSLAEPRAFATVVSPESPFKNRGLKQTHIRATKAGVLVGSLSRNTLKTATVVGQRSRDNVETSPPTTQVTRLWGYSTIHCCYICGFPIADQDGNFPHTRNKHTRQIIHGQGVGEHVLPAAVGFGFVGLFQVDYARGIQGEWLPEDQPRINEKTFLKHEMRWAHQWCNKIKGNILFTHFSDDSGLILQQANVVNFINDLWRGQINEQGTRVFFQGEYGIDGTDGTSWDHLIHYWLDRCSSGQNISDEKEWRKFVDAWKKQRVEYICQIVKDLCDEVNNHAQKLFNSTPGETWLTFLANNYSNRLVSVNEDIALVYLDDVRKWQQYPVTIMPKKNLYFPCTDRELYKRQHLISEAEPTGGAGGGGSFANGSSNFMEFEQDTAGDAGRNMEKKFTIVNKNTINYYLIPYDKLRPEIQNSFNDKYLGGSFNPISTLRVMSVNYPEDFVLLNDGFILSRSLTHGGLKKINYLLIPQNIPGALHHFAKRLRTRKTRKRNQRRRKTRKV